MERPVQSTGPFSFILLSLLSFLRDTGGSERDHGFFDDESL